MLFINSFALQFLKINFNCLLETTSMFWVFITERTTFKYTYPKRKGNVRKTWDYYIFLICIISIEEESYALHGFWYPLALHAKPYAFTAVGNEISQSFNILCCNCIQDGAMSLNPEWNSNSQSRDTWHSTQFVSDRPVFSPGDGRMVGYKIHNTISFIVSISREPFVLKMHNSLAVVF